MTCAAHFNFHVLGASAVPVLAPASKDAAAIGSLFLIVSVICLVIFVVMVSLICMSLWRSRNSGNGTPPQNFGSRGIQIAWTMPPVLIVFTLRVLSARLIVADE